MVIRLDNPSDTFLDLPVTSVSIIFSDMATGVDDESINTFMAITTATREHARRSLQVCFHTISRGLLVSFKILPNVQHQHGML